MSNMVIRKDQEEIIINMGALNYGAQLIANILHVSQKDVEQELKKRDSQLNQLLAIGQDMYEYKIDLKLFEMAQAGDLKALDKLERRKMQRK